MRPERLSKAQSQDAVAGYTRDGHEHDLLDALATDVGQIFRLLYLGNRSGPAVADETQQCHCRQDREHTLAAGMASTSYCGHDMAPAGSTRPQEADMVLDSQVEGARGVASDSMQVGQDFDDRTVRERAEEIACLSEVEAFFARTRVVIAGLVTDSDDTKCMANDECRRASC